MWVASANGQKIDPSQFPDQSHPVNSHRRQPRAQQLNPVQKTKPEENAGSLRLNHCSFSLAATQVTAAPGEYDPSAMA